jgi:ketosteroid isomerase-like protein
LFELTEHGGLYLVDNVYDMRRARARKPTDSVGDLPRSLQRCHPLNSTNAAECPMLTVRRIAVLSLTAAMSSPGLAGAQDADKASVVATVQRLFDALEARDSVAGLATFHPSATILVAAGAPPTVTQTTPAALVGSIARSTAGTFKERIFDTEVHIDGDVAQLWAYFTVHIGNAFNRCGTDAMTLVRMSGEWKISHAAFTRRTEGCRHSEPLSGRTHDD